METVEHVQRVEAGFFDAPNKSNLVNGAFRVLCPFCRTFNYIYREHPGDFKEGRWAILDVCEHAERLGGDLHENPYDTTALVEFCGEVEVQASREKLMALKADEAETEPDDGFVGLDEIDRDKHQPTGYRLGPVGTRQDADPEHGAYARAIDREPEDIRADHSSEETKQPSG